MTSDRSTVEELLAEFIERRMAGDRDVSAESLAPNDPKLAADLAERIRVYEQVEGLLGGAPRVTEGERVGRYRIEGRLGRGGMGEVFRAHDTELDRPVALKFLTVARGGNEAVRRRLLREARAAAALDHPNLCPVYEVGDAGDGRLFLAMALVEGESLAERLERGPLPMGQLLDVARQAAAGLAEAHRRGIVHRDVKPANLMLGPSGAVKLLDFGLAQRDGQEGRSLEGLRPGTLAYMAPEQLRGEPIDSRSDVWALGAVMVEMATGRSPFAGPTPEATLYSIAHRSPSGLEALSPALRRVARKALQRKPEKRFVDAGELLAALPDEAGVPVRASPLGRWAGRLRRRTALAATAVAVAVIALGLSVAHGPLRLPWNEGRLVDWSPDREAPVVELKSTIEARLARSRADAAGPSVGVISFENLGSPEQDHLAPALTDLVRTDLAKLGGVRLVKQIPRSPETEPAARRDLARRLGVDYLVDGGVRGEGDRVLVTARLEDATSGEGLWSERYDVSPAELYDVQGLVVRSISDAIRVKRSAEEEARLGAAPVAKTRPPPVTDDLRVTGPIVAGRTSGFGESTETGDVDPTAISSEAADAYFRGLHLAGRAQTLGPDFFDLLRGAEAHFLRAVELKPTWAEAWGELAIVEQQLGDMLDSAGARSVARSKTSRYAQRALELDPAVASAHRAMAAVHYWNLDLLAAEREHLEALRLEPNTDSGLYGETLAAGGRYVEAVRWLRHARDLNPLDARIGFLIGRFSVCGGDLSAADAQVRELREVYANETLAVILSAMVAERRGLYERAVAILEANRDALMVNFATTLHRRLAYALAKSGRDDEARAVLETMQRRWATGPDPNVLIALGDQRAAERRVRDYYRRRSTTAVGAACWPEIDALMKNPEIARMLRELNRPGAL